MTSPARAALLLSALLTGGPAAAADVLVVHGTDDVGDVVTSLYTSLFIGAVDTWDGRIATPQLADLQDYDAVVLAPEGAWASPTLLGDVLADYVDAGGGVVDTQPWYPGGVGIGGRFASYVAIRHDASVGPADDLVAISPSHPVLAGVFSFSDNGYLHSATATAPLGATLIAQWSLGSALAAEWQPSIAGTVVSLNLSALSADVRPGSWERGISEGGELLANAARHAAGETPDARLYTAPSGPCPGRLALGFVDATPFGEVAFITGAYPGLFIVPNGRCAGTAIPFGFANVRRTVVADAGGSGFFMTNPGPGACGTPYIALDLSTCEVSNLSALP